jgi:hypothetical protein
MNRDPEKTGEDKVEATTLAIFINRQPVMPQDNNLPPKLMPPNSKLLGHLPQDPSLANQTNRASPRHVYLFS